MVAGAAGNASAVTLAADPPDIPDVWLVDERLERIAALRALNPGAYACLDASVRAELAAYLAAKAAAAAIGPPAST